MVTAIKERPILFSGPMVRAILAGTKTQTRRVMKVQPVKKGHFLEVYGAGWSDGIKSVPAVHGHSLAIKCPYGQVGERLWIKTGYKTRFDVNFNQTYWSIDSKFITTHGQAFSKSGKPKRDGGHPSMFMPYWLSQELRLPLLEITGILVERLNDISRGDCMAEGCPFANMADGPDPRQWYRELWESINGDGSWSLNPWVWVVEFKRVAQ